MSESINKRVRIKSRAKIYVGELGTAIDVTENLLFQVVLDRDGFTTTMWFDFEELEFLK